MGSTISPEHQRDVLADLERALQDGAVAVTAAASRARTTWPTGASSSPVWRSGATKVAVHYGS